MKHCDQDDVSSPIFQEHVKYHVRHGVKLNLPFRCVAIVYGTSQKKGYKIRLEHSRVR